LKVLIDLFFSQTAKMYQEFESSAGRLAPFASTPKSGRKETIASVEKA
jgi:hypothetical protein